MSCVTWNQSQMLLPLFSVFPLQFLIFLTQQTATLQGMAILHYQWEAAEAQLSATK